MEKGRHFDRDIVVVLGMHRSGTSMVAAGLGALGVDLGERLMPGDIGDNDKGYFENPDVVQLNDELLEFDGFHWASLAFGSPLDYSATRYDKFRDAAKSILEGEYRSSIIALKDPRMCLTLPFWQGVFEASFPGARTIYVHVSRHPLEIAASFAARERSDRHRHLVEFTGGDQRQSVLLWLSYSYLALRSSFGYCSYVVQHRDLVADPRGVLSGVAKVCGLSNFEDGLEQFASSFFDKSLVHHAAVNEMVSSVFSDLIVIDDVWGEISKRRGELSHADHRALIGFFPDLEFAYRFSAQAKDLVVARRELLVKKCAIADLRKAVEARERAVVEAYQLVGSKDKQLAVVGGELTKTAEQLLRTESEWEKARIALEDIGRVFAESGLAAEAPEDWNLALREMAHKLSLENARLRLDCESAQQEAHRLEDVLKDIYESRRCCWTEPFARLWQSWRR